MTTTTKPVLANRLIKAYLIFAAIVNAYVTLRLFEIWRDLTTHSDPNLPHWPFLVLTLLGFLGIVSLGGLWFWKKWGYVGYLSVSLISMLVTLMGLKAPMGSVVTSVTGLGIFVAIFTPRLKEMT